MSFKSVFLVILFYLVSWCSFGQEVKLGLPVGHSDLVTQAIYRPNGKQILTKSKDGYTRYWDVESGKLLFRFKSCLGRAVFSPDGNKILFGSGSLMDAESGELLINLVVDENEASIALFSPDGKKILTVAGDRTVRLWDSESGKILNILEGHKETINSAVFSPDGERILTASRDKKVYLWDSESGEILNILEGHKASVNSAIFSPNGKQVLTASHQQPAHIYDASSGRQLIVIDGYKSFVKSATFSPDGKKVITISGNGALSICDALSGVILNTFIGIYSSSVFSPDGKHILTDGSSVRLWDAESGKLLKDRFAGKSAGFSPDGKQILCYSNRTASIFDTVTGKLLMTLRGDENEIHSAFFSPDGKNILTASKDKTAQLWDAQSGKPLMSLVGHTSRVENAKFSSNGKYILTNSADFSSRLWDAKSGNLLYMKNVTKDYSDMVLNSILSPDGKRILILFYEQQPCIWDVESGKEIIIRKGKKNYILDGVFSSDSKLVITISRDETIHTWDAISGKLLGIISPQSNLKYFTFSSDGKLALTVSKDLKASIWDTLSGKLLITLEGQNTWSKYSSIIKAEFSPNGKQVLTVSIEDVAGLWDVKSGKLLREFRLKGQIRSANFSQDGKQILTSSSNFSPVGRKGILTSSRTRVLHIWDSESGKVINILKGHIAPINTAVFSPDGKKYLTSSKDGSFIIGELYKSDDYIQSFMFDGDPQKWVHLHSSGLFDASPKAMELMYWTKGLEAIEFSQLKDHYWYPDLWEKVMKGEKLPDVRDMSELKLQPKVELNNITEESVTVNLAKREGGYGKVSLFINGKEAIKDIRPSNMDYTLNEQTINISIKDHPYILDGENEVKVKASSEDGFVQGRGSKGKAIVKKKEYKEPHFYSVIVGIGDYANDQLNLKYTVKDAEAISKAMQLGAENLFDKDKTHIYTITTNGDELPTKENIKSIFKEISTKASAEDVIAVYLSGHGITWGGNQGDFYFLTSDATATSNVAFNDSITRDKKTISTSEWVEWLKEIPALKQVMIIDACGSGKAVDNLISERGIEPSQKKAIDRMKDRTGMYIISGCTANAVSYEASVYGQGLLTYSILQAFKGAALKEDKYVDIFTILDYARETVPDLAEGIGGIQEPQLLIPKGGSFDIGLLEDDDKIAIPLASPKTVYVRSTLFNAEEFEDTLGLTEMLNEELSSFSSKGKGSSLVYFDAAKFPNACKISGGYTIGDNEISISIKLRCGEDLKSFSLNTESKEELIQEIVKTITK